MLRHPVMAPVVQTYRPGLVVAGAIAVLAATLLLTTSAASATGQDAIVVRYTENEESPVVALTSTDPEGMGVHWEVTGLDSDDFQISQQGVLTFSSPPDFEAPTDREMLSTTDPGTVVEEGRDNEYHVVVHAIEERSPGESRLALSSRRDVIIAVRNVDEPGLVSLNRLQPEVGTPVTAILTDGAGIDGDVMWQWHTSKVVEPDPNYASHWAAVEDASAATYVPRGDRVEGVVESGDDPDGPVDEGRYLRVVASYTDGHGIVKTATAASVRPVRTEVSSDLDVGFGGNPDNGSPGFPPNLSYDFTLPENSVVGTPVGRPVVALDPNEDILTYELDDTRSDADVLDESRDVGSFSIDMATGQIEVGSEGLNFEDRPERPYRFYVRAIDPCGETAEVEVTISLTDVNDPPVVGGITPGSDPPSTVWVDEEVDGRTFVVPTDVTSGEDYQNVFTVSDEDHIGQVFVTLEGRDSAAFLLADVTVGDRDGLNALLFDNPADYEKPADAHGHNVYRVTLVATDSEGAETRLPLIVVVGNVPEGGGVTMRAQGPQPLQPRVDEWMHAELTDPDGDVAAVTWQWSRAEHDAEGTIFEIIPGATGRSYMPTEEDTGHFLRLTATYIDSTSETDDPRTTNIDERVQKVIDSRITAKTAGDSHAEDRLYRVTSTTAYSVRSKDVDGAPGAPTGFEHSSYDREVAENSETGTIVGAPVQVQDHSDATTYELDDQFPSDHFTIDRHGQIRVGAVPVSAGNAYPQNASPAATTTDPDLDHERTGTYILTVRAAAGGDISVTRVNVKLGDVNEPPHFTGRTLENAATPIAFPERTRDVDVVRLTAEEPDGVGLRWELTGPDAGSFTVDGGRLTFRERPDFERPGSIAGTNMYAVTAVVTELSAVGGGPLRSAELPVNVEVTNRNDPGSVKFNLLQPEVGTPLSAGLSDVDHPVSGAVWTWYRARVTSPSPEPGAEPSALAAEWSLIETADSEEYTPADTDRGRYLLARVTYVDALGDDNVTLAMTSHPVRADVPDDANNAPGFRSAEITITVPESLPVGEAVGQPVVVAMNADDEVLTYDLDDDFDRGTEPGMNGDFGFFTIDRATGQLTLRKTLSHEATDGRDYTDTDSPIAPGVYTVVVRATDPSGEAGGDSDDVVVRVIATDVNDAPRIVSGMSELSVHEVDGSREDADGTRYVGLGYLLEDGATAPTLDPDSPNMYRVSDDDALESHTWPTPIAGPDGGLFEYSSTGSVYGRRLHFRSRPDYEDPRDLDGDNVYELTIRAVDRSGAVAEKDVRVRVLNVNEKGSLSITPEQPVAGSAVVAVLTDPDGIISVTDWRWATSSHSISELTSGNAAEGSSTGSYTGKAGEFLRVTVRYRDGASVEDNPMTVFDERNDNPVTPQGVAIETGFDSDEVLSAATRYAVNSPNSADRPPARDQSRASPVTIDMEVAENTPGTGYAGQPVTGLSIRKTTGGLDNGMFVFAEDHDARADGYYDGALAPERDMDDKMDQLALKPGIRLDFEGNGNGYVLELPMAGGDPDEAAFIVKVTVTDVNEPPSIPQRSTGLRLGNGSGPTFAHSTSTRQVAENSPPGTEIGVPVSANHQDPDEQVSYLLRGEDSTLFEVASSTGQLLNRVSLDYETRSGYLVEVLATDTTGSTVAATVSIVVVNVGLDTRYDVNDSGSIERDEIQRAVRDYFSGDPEVAPSREEILELISMYLDG